MDFAPRRSPKNWGATHRDGARAHPSLQNEEGLDGLGDRPGAGRKRRITETERSLIISLVGTDPPGRLVRGAGGELEASDEEREAHYWTLDALTDAAQARGIVVGLKAR
jgi:hypothetical protein